MKTLVISQREVARLLPMKECTELMAETLRTLSRGDAVLPLRTAMWLPDRSGLLGVMPAFLGKPRSMGLKAVSVMPGNHGTPYDSHQGAVLLFEADHGSLLAVIDGSSVTAIRTAAVRTLRRVRVWSRNRAHARLFAERESGRCGCFIEASESAREAVEGADLICTVTASREPVLQGDWIAPGAHVNAVGASFQGARELDTRAVARARLYVDRRESALHESGDFLIPREEGAIGDDHIVGEIGDVLLGKVPGRRSAEEITLFKSLGLGVEDVAAARLIYENALRTGAGTAVELGGQRDPGD